jgi:DNA-binding NarL/FixJ family response regulator
MRRDINILIVEDDPFAREWATLLVARDHRVRSLKEFAHPLGLITVLQRRRKKQPRIDLVLLDVDTPDGEDWLRHIQEIWALAEHKPKLLCMGLHAREPVLRQALEDPACCGYILKQEINYSLAWAVVLAMDGRWVMTPSVSDLHKQRFAPSSRQVCVLDGRSSTVGMTPEQLRTARLGILFSLERDPMADDLGMAVNSLYTRMSELYDWLGLTDMLKRGTPDPDLLGNSPTLFRLFNKVVRQLSSSGQGPLKEVLAFYLLTRPEILE